MTSQHAPIYLAGQTGCGKTAVALEIAKQLGGVEIINADAYQVYRGIEILSAAPSAGEQEQCPHHLFGILGPDEECDAATFAKMAKAAIEKVSNRAVPLVVGGSGLYLKAITHGLAPTPKSEPELREKLDKRSLESLIEEYERLDPDGAAQTNLKNRRYVTRNLEICLLSGRSASEIKKEWENNAPELDAAYLFRDREIIYERINQRTHAMIAAGAIAEIAALPNFSATAAKAIGIREIKAHLAGEITRNEMIEQIQQITRRYAKRQASWFKRESAFQRVEISTTESPAETASRILSELERTRP
ncbi:tRNA (adenosine(37)-N6)-dimethylallyltransferase MiaA [Verrucomicrobiales bacterium]|jgi:tRNA dimethylallyltransferase|nr:tRNA (adenosine(37)-N6)-dimethylallyltransferase MiaA [Verrucomicrobiales bacterium]MDA7926471.1 tRNA (adenosine(37)-N6)-dimethylallyltransferase MiaA [Verrucomicrobiales bacterium]